MQIVVIMELVLRVFSSFFVRTPTNRFDSVEEQLPPPLHQLYEPLSRLQRTPTLSSSVLAPVNTRNVASDNSNNREKMIRFLKRV